ncbi:hypothetical protein J6590_011284 [Homalodisca vitripennis]|nr:hypothetical protein J6590_011284 [Homalodisca vitripennis]
MKRSPHCLISVGLVCELCCKNKVVTQVSRPPHIDWGPRPMRPNTGTWLRSMYLCYPGNNKIISFNIPDVYPSPLLRRSSAPSPPGARSVHLPLPPPLPLVAAAAAAALTISPRAHSCSTGRAQKAGTCALHFAKFKCIVSTDIN